LTQWIRHPHPQYGTPHRILHIIFALQVIAVVACRGNAVELAQAYAFGIGWGLVLKAVSVAVLRHKMPETREWRMPLNVRFGRYTFPLGIALLTAALLALACVNLVTRIKATIYGMAFTVIFFLVFGVMAKYSNRRPSHP